jgi:hypothetical protein
MCEIVAIVLLAMKVSKIAGNKGRSSAGYVVLFISGWVGGEFLGVILSFILARGEPELVVAYGFALVGAAIGAGSVFTLVALLPPLEDDDYDNPWRKRRGRYEDDIEDGDRPRGSDFDDDESYREKFRPSRQRAAEDQSSEDDESYRRKRRPSEE